MTDYGQAFLQAALADQQRNEANARARTFDVGKVASGVLGSVLTGGLSLPSMLAAGGLAAAGEGVRAATGSQTDIAGLLGQIPGALNTANLIKEKGMVPSEVSMGGIKYGLPDSALKPENFLKYFKPYDPVPGTAVPDGLIEAPAFMKALFPGTKYFLYQKPMDFNEMMENLRGGR